MRLIVILLPWLVSIARADCIDQAAARHDVNSFVLRAIGWHESRLKSGAVGRNQNGTFDIGAFQINTTHLRTLSRYGIDEQALKDGCVSAYVGAWHYRKQVLEFGNTWYAVGAYHSRTPARAAWYANSIALVLMAWKVMPSGPLPYPSDRTLAPGQRATPRPSRAIGVKNGGDQLAIFDKPNTTTE